MQNNPKKAEIPCPICSHKFIPEAFHIEKTIMDTRVDGKGTHIMRFYANLENYCNSAINNSIEKNSYLNHYCYLGFFQ